MPNGGAPQRSFPPFPNSPEHGAKAELRKACVELGQVPLWLGPRFDGHPCGLSRSARKTRWRRTETCSLARSSYGSTTALSGSGARPDRPLVSNRPRPRRIALTGSAMLTRDGLLAIAEPFHRAKPIDRTAAWRWRRCFVRFPPAPDLAKTVTWSDRRPRTGVRSRARPRLAVGRESLARRSQLECRHPDSLAPGSSSFAPSPTKGSRPARHRGARTRARRSEVRLGEADQHENTVASKRPANGVSSQTSATSQQTVIRPTYQPRTRSASIVGTASGRGTSDRRVQSRRHASTRSKSGSTASAVATRRSSRSGRWRARGSCSSTRRGSGRYAPVRVGHPLVEALLHVVPWDERLPEVEDDRPVLHVLSSFLTSPQGRVLRI